MQLDAEEDASGQPSVWRDVYNLMRCPGPPCHLGPQCWRDSVSMKHYKLKTHHLRSIIRHIEQGHILQTHDDMPWDIQEQLYAEEHQDLERQRKRTTPSAPGYPPINITNVMPGQSPPAEVSFSAASTPASRPCTSLDIPGLRDMAVRRYSDWQCSQVGDESLKSECQKACNLTLDDGLDLEQVYEDQDAQFCVDKGVKRGIARRFVRDIEVWATRYGSM